MLVFPQLAPGSMAVYPIRRQRRLRTVVNRLADGSAVDYLDPDWLIWEWTLEMRGLSEVEWEAIHTLHTSMQGRLGSFTFLEPAGNLLKQSELFDAPEWNNDPLISATPGIDDPFGTMRAMRALNTAGAAGEVAQDLSVPGDFVYALSVWARSVGGSNVALVAETTGASTIRAFTLTSEWKRLEMPVALGQSTESVRFGARIETGDEVDLFGMQVEAQPGVGGYQKTGPQGGVHSAARFMDDVLPVRAQSTDVFDASVRVVSKGS